MKPLYVAALLSPLLSVLSAQPGSPSEPVRLLSAGIDLQVHDGRLRPAIGVENIQVMRANRTHPDLADGLGWTYHHAPMLAYWQGRFFLEFLSNPFGEHHAPGQTLIVTSRDGRNWDKPQPIFPIYYVRPGPISGHEPGMAMMHQRMGFYVAPNGRLLVLGHYGLAPDPMGEKGIGRVVREALADGSYGPIYFIRYNSLAGANEKNTTRFPFYRRAPDEGFVSACDALLADKLKTMQWREEDRSEDGFYTTPGPVLQAPSVFHRQDGMAVALWKASWAALSADEGKTWSTPIQLQSIVTGGAKTWAQRTDDGRYAMVYNPAKLGRWPLAVATSDDGVTFDNLLLVNGEVPQRRFFGRAKDFGLQYTRGISEGNGNPPGSDLWVTYSSNKEDIWISRIPVPVRSAVVGPVVDAFDQLDVGGTIPDWNVYRPRWANVSIAEFPSAANKSLLLEDRDPYDHAKAVRVFPEAKSVRIAFRIFARQVDAGRMEIEVLDGAGHRPVRITLGEDGRVRASDGSGQVDAGPFLAGRWYQAELSIDAATGRYDLSWDGRVIVRQAAFAEAATTVERLSFCTGAFRTEPTRQTNRYGVLADVEKPDTAVTPASYYLDDVAIK